MLFMWKVLTENGLKVSSEKVKSVVEAPRSMSKFEMRRFLGLAQFCSKIFGNFASSAGPLCNLTRSDTEWKWTDKEEKALNELKKI